MSEQENNANEASPETDDESNKSGKQEKKFDRGSALSIFGSDRKEDVMALLLALFIAAAVYFFI